MGWLVTAGILVLLAVLPLGVHIRYNSEGLLAKVIAGPVKITVFPLPKKAKKKAKETAREAVQEENPPKPPQPPKAQKEKKPKEEKGKLDGFPASGESGSGFPWGFSQKTTFESHGTEIDHGGR